MSIETRANNHYSTKMKKSRRAIKEEVEEVTVSEVEDFRYDPKGYEAARARQERIHRRGEFWSNLMDNVLVPLSVVALFCIYVYAEVNRSTGY